MSAATATASTHGERAIDRPGRRLPLALVLGGLCVVLDTTITVVAVPALVRELDSSLATMQWTTTGYLLGLIATLPLSAWAARRFGARRSYVTAIGVFGVGSALAALALGPATLIAARVVQGLGGGLVTPLGTVLAMRGVAAEHRGRVAALLGLPLMIGPLAGPLTAGWLVDTVSWRAIFVVTVPPAVACALLVHRWATPDRPERPERPDRLGAALVVVTTVTVVGGVSLSPWLLPVSVGAGAWFVVRSVRHVRPLLDLGLLGRPGYRAALLVLMLFGAVYFGSMLLMPSYVQVTRGETATLTAVLMVPAALATGLTAQVTTRLVDRVPGHRIVTTGLVLGVVSVGAGVAVLRTDTPLAVIAALGGLLGIASGCTLLPAMTLATRDLDGDDLGSGSTLMALAQQVAGAVGTAAVIGLFTALTPSGAGAGALVTAQRLTQATTVLALLAALAVCLLALRPAERRREDSG